MTKMILSTGERVEFNKQPSAVFNPFAEADASWIEEFLRSTCAEGLTTAEQREVEDQIEALVPALVELRDGGYIDLNAKSLVDFATLNGFSELASDDRLTVLSRQRCEAIRVRLMVQGVRGLLGQK